jgi:hypothetical protein
MNPHKPNEIDPKGSTSMSTTTALDRVLSAAETLVRGYPCQSCGAAIGQPCEGPASHSSRWDQAAAAGHLPLPPRAHTVPLTGPLEPRPEPPRTCNRCMKEKLVSEFRRGHPTCRLCERPPERRRKRR